MFFFRKKPDNVPEDLPLWRFKECEFQAHGGHDCMQDPEK
jgi:hypothetical protein